MRHMAGQRSQDRIAVVGIDGEKKSPATTRNEVPVADPVPGPPQAISSNISSAAKSAASSGSVQRQRATVDNGTSTAAKAKLPKPGLTAAEKPEAKNITGEVSTPPSTRNISISELEAVLVNFVVEQTGYPAEMVELDADLEADLGIDSIKKAQMLGELAEQLDLKINISEDMSLDDFPTLRHITEFLRKAAKETEAPAHSSEATTVQEKSATKQPSARPADSSLSNGSYRNGVDHSRSVGETRSSVAVEASTVAPETPVRAVSNAGSKLNSADLQLLLVNFVVEQTGYPPEMVELDADLEADLGIDSIKKAQLFGELAEQLNIQIKITEEMSLDDFPTLRHVLRALESASADLTAVEQIPTLGVPAKAKPVSADAVQDAANSTKLAVASLKPEELEAFLVNFVVEQTGYPPEMVELDADLEADLGIDSIKKAQLFGELAENLDVQIQITEEMSLDNYRTLRDVLNLLVQETK